MTPTAASELYAPLLPDALQSFDWRSLEPVAEAIRQRWKDGRKIFLCGNGGSAANAAHLANDFVYGVSPQGKAIRAVSLTDNAAILTCLANDTSYGNIFAHQLATLGEAGDLLIVFSGSGNSPNVVAALRQAKELGLQTAAILGFAGGECLELADLAVHFAIEDMQLAEDLQQVVGHMLTRWLRERPPSLGLEAATPATRPRQRADWPAASPATQRRMG